MITITAAGNLGKDPVSREAGANSVASFTLACKSGPDETTWINCSVWGKRSDVVMKFLKKGDQVTVSGRGKMRVYTDKDGTERRSLDMDVADFTLPPKPQEVKF